MLVLKRHAECPDIRVNDVEELYRFAKLNKIDLTVVGSEIAISSGVVDRFREEGLLIFGPCSGICKD